MTQALAPRLIVGLGNPGAEYADTRHNAGYWLLERLAAERRLTLAPQSRFHGLVARDGDCWLLQPSTFMNRSGQAVAALARFHKIEAGEVLVIHDELDLPPGEIKIKRGGGNAGHNGLKDISAHFGTPDFWRLRLGIGHPGDRSEVANYVLHRPRAEERLAIDAALDRCLLAWPRLAAGDYTAAMAALHGRPPARN